MFTKKFSNEKRVSSVAMRSELALFSSVLGYSTRSAPSVCYRGRKKNQTLYTEVVTAKLVKVENGEKSLSYLFHNVTLKEFLIKLDIFSRRQNVRAIEVRTCLSHLQFFKPSAS
jgi:hypothetical protein